MRNYSWSMILHSFMLSKMQSFQQKIWIIVELKLVIENSSGKQIFTQIQPNKRIKTFSINIHKKKKNLPLFFNQSSVIQTTSQKHFGMVLGSQHDFKEHLQNILNKLSKITSLPRKLQNVLPRSSLLKLRWC